MTTPTEAGGVDRCAGGRPAQWLRERSQGGREARELTPVTALLALAVPRPGDECLVKPGAGF